MVKEFAFSPDVIDAVDWGAAPDRKRLDEVVDALDTLPVDLRDLVTAVYYQGKSKRAMARELNVSRVEIDRRMLRAFAALREVLARGQEED